MDADPELARLVAAESAADAARRLIAERAARRSAGVAWSGLAPEPCARRGGEALLQAANARLAALQALRAAMDEPPPPA